MLRIYMWTWICVYKKFHFKIPSILNLFNLLWVHRELTDLPVTTTPLTYMCDLVSYVYSPTDSQSKMFMILRINHSIKTLENLQKLFISRHASNLLQILFIPSRWVSCLSFNNLLITRQLMEGKKGR